MQGPHRRGLCQGERGPGAEALVSFLPTWPLVLYGISQALLPLLGHSSPTPEPAKGPVAHHAKAEGICVHSQSPCLHVLLGQVGQGATHGPSPGHRAALAGTGPCKTAKTGQAKVSQFGHQSLIQKDIGTWGGKERCQIGPGQLCTPHLPGSDSTGLRVVPLPGGSFTQFGLCSSLARGGGFLSL